MADEGPSKGPSTAPHAFRPDFRQVTALTALTALTPYGESAVSALGALPHAGLLGYIFAALSPPVLRPLAPEKIASLSFRVVPHSPHHLADVFGKNALLLKANPLLSRRFAD